MRNPDRIDDVLERMKACWKKVAGLALYAVDV